MKVGPEHSFWDTRRVKEYVSKPYETEVKDKADDEIEAMAGDVCSLILGTPFALHQLLSVVVDC